MKKDSSKDKTFLFRVCYDIQNVLGFVFVPFQPIEPFATNLNMEINFHNSNTKK